MAGVKPAKAVDTTGMSKTARASALKKGGGKQEGFIASGDMERIVSLGGGSYIYLMDPRDGKTLHLKVGSARYESVLLEVLDHEKHGDRVRGELVSKGFPIPVAPIEVFDNA